MFLLLKCDRYLFHCFSLALDKNQFFVLFVQDLQRYHIWVLDVIDAVNYRSYVVGPLLHAFGVGGLLPVGFLRRAQITIGKHKCWIVQRSTLIVIDCCDVEGEEKRIRFLLQLTLIGNKTDQFWFIEA